MEVENLKHTAKRYLVGLRKWVSARGAVSNIKAGGGGGVAIYEDL